MEVLRYQGNWHKPRGVPIPDTQVSFDDEEGGGGDEVVDLSFFVAYA